MLSALSVDNDQPGRRQRLAGGDDKHSQPNAELAKGRQVRMPHARRLDAVDGPRAPQRLAQQEQPPWLHDMRKNICFGGATRSEPSPSLDSEFRKS